MHERNSRRREMDITLLLFSSMRVVYYHGPKNDTQIVMCMSVNTLHT